MEEDELLEVADALLRMYDAEEEALGHSSAIVPPSDIDDEGTTDH